MNEKLRNAKIDMRVAEYDLREYVKDIGLDDRVACATEDEYDDYYMNERSVMDNDGYWEALGDVLSEAEYAQLDRLEDALARTQHTYWRVKREAGAERAKKGWETRRRNEQARRGDYSGFEDLSI